MIGKVTVSDLVDYMKSVKTATVTITRAAVETHFNTVIKEDQVFVFGQPREDGRTALVFVEARIRGLDEKPDGLLSSKF